MLQMANGKCSALVLTIWRAFQKGFLVLRISTEILKPQMPQCNVGGWMKIEESLCLNSIGGKNGENGSFRTVEAASQDEQPPPFWYAALVLERFWWNSDINSDTNSDNNPDNNSDKNSNKNSNNNSDTNSDTNPDNNSDRNSDKNSDKILICCSRSEMIQLDWHCADWSLPKIYQNNSLLDLWHKESSDVSKSVGDPVKSAWPDGKFSAWQPNQDQRGPVGRQVDEILDVAGHRAPVEGEGEHEDGNCCHLDRRQFSNQNRDDPHNGP